MRILTAKTEFFNACIQVGDTVKLMYVPQDRMNLDSDKTVFENINNGYVLLDYGLRAKLSQYSCCPRVLITFGQNLVTRFTPGCVPNGCQVVVIRECAP